MLDFLILDTMISNLRSPFYLQADASAADPLAPDYLML